MDKNVEYKVEVSTAAAEAAMDRLIEKAERLEATLLRIKGLSEAATVTGTPQPPQPPQLVYSVNMGDIMQLANAPQAIFTPAMLDQLGRDIPTMVKAMPKKPAPNPANSGSYKKGKIVKIAEA